MHGKRAIVETNGLLSAKQLTERVCSHFGCSQEPPLSLPEKVAWILHWEDDERACGQMQR